LNDYGAIPGLLSDEVLPCRIAVAKAKIAGRSGR
jgi:hypothetical protein